MGLRQKLDSDPKTLKIREAVARKFGKAFDTKVNPGSVLLLNHGIPAKDGSIRGSVRVGRACVNFHTNIRSIEKPAGRKAA